MSQQRFSDIDRRSIWEIHRKRCCYCSQPIRFSELLIDHVIPEWLAKLGADLPEGLRLTNMTGTTVFVQTAAEYELVTAQGYEPYTTFEMKMAAFFERTLGVLKAIKTAKPANISYLRDPRIDLSTLGVLPVDLLPRLTQLDLEEEPWLKNCKSLEDVRNGGKLILQSRTSYSVEFQYQGMERTIVELMRADIDGDGIEDVLVFIYDRAIGGTFGFGFSSLLTRHAEDSLIEMMRWPLKHRDRSE